MKLVTQEQLKKCITLQKKAKDEQNTYIPITTLFISHGIITQKRIEEIIRSREVYCSVRETIWKNDPRRTGLKGRVLGGYQILSKIAAGGMGGRL